MNSVENDRGKCLTGEVNDPSTLKTVAGGKKYVYLSADNVRILRNEIVFLVVGIGTADSQNYCLRVRGMFENF